MEEDDEDDEYEYSERVRVNVPLETGALLEAEELRNRQSGCEE